MNEQFRVAQKLGLMFRPETPLPEDIKSWAISQLNAKSPALGIKSFKSMNSDIKEWPRELQPNLKKRAEMWTVYRANRKKEREKIDGQETEAAKRANEHKNLMGQKDSLKFSHRNVYGQDQLKIRFMNFWANHFTTGNIHDNQNVIGHLIDEAILANLNSSFSEMLYKATSHPSMLTYLDNIWSSGEDSVETREQRRNGRQAGLNDNLGRELLELHSVSPSAKYSETDIRNAANVLAGWGTDLERPLNEMREVANTTDHWDLYKRTWAQPGVKRVMGKTINQGKGGLRELTDFLAMHEHTISYLSNKLAQHFVSDNPSQSDISYIKNAWKKGSGNLDQIHTAVIERAILSKEPKFQWPMTWLFQTIRLSNATFFMGWDEVFDYDDNLMNHRQTYEELGQSFWHPRQPDGYSSDKNEWLSGEMFERRIRFADAIYRAGNPQFSSSQIMDRIGANGATRDLVKRAGQYENEKFIALMCSPELMGLENA